MIYRFFKKITAKAILIRNINPIFNNAFLTDILLLKILYIKITSILSQLVEYLSLGAFGMIQLSLEDFKEICDNKRERERERERERLHGYCRSELDTCTCRVVTKIEGSTLGDTAATTSAKLRRSDRGGFLTTHCDIVDAKLQTIEMGGGGGQKMFIYTCINQTASSSPLCIPLKIAAAKEDMYFGSSVGGVFSSNFPKRVIFADGYTFFKAAGTFPEKADIIRDLSELTTRCDSILVVIPRNRSLYEKSIILDFGKKS
ncbi:hypothetical protein LXL04_009594 [Taraxacum kok-saghyz]